MSTYYIHKVTDDGVEFKFLAPMVSINDINIESYEHEHALSVMIPANEFFGTTKFVRQVSDRLDVANVSAEIDSGILTVFVPYAESKKPRRIEIKEVKAQN